MRIDENDGIMKVTGEIVLKTKVINNEMILQWFGTWAEWAEFHDAEELNVLKEKFEIGMKGVGGKGTAGKGKRSE